MVLAFSWMRVAWGFRVGSAHPDQRRPPVRVRDAQFALAEDAVHLLGGEAAAHPGVLAVVGPPHRGPDAGQTPPVGQGRPAAVHLRRPEVAERGHLADHHPDTVDHPHAAAGGLPVVVELEHDPGQHGDHLARELHARHGRPEGGVRVGQRQHRRQVVRQLDRLPVRHLEAPDEGEQPVVDRTDPPFVELGGRPELPDLIRRGGQQSHLLAEERRGGVHGAPPSGSPGGPVLRRNGVALAYEHTPAGTRPRVSP